MTTSTESHTEVTSQARPATEKPVEVGKSLSQRLIGQKLPSVDLTQPVAWSLAPLKKGIDLNRNLATQGADLVVNGLRHVREQAQRVRSIVKDQADPAADLSTTQAEREQADREQAEREQAERTLEAAKRKLEAAQRRREAATRKLEAAKRKRERPSARRPNARRPNASRPNARRPRRRARPSARRRNSPASCRMPMPAAHRCRHGHPRYLRAGAKRVPALPPRHAGRGG